MVPSVHLFRFIDPPFLEAHIDPISQLATGTVYLGLGQGLRHSQSPWTSFRGKDQDFSKFSKSLIK